MLETHNAAKNSRPKNPEHGPDHHETTVRIFRLIHAGSEVRTPNISACVSTEHLSCPMLTTIWLIFETGAKNRPE